MSPASLGSIARFRQCLASSALAAILAACSSRPVPMMVTQHPGTLSGRECSVCSRTFWNDTGIDLKKGSRYRFEVRGQWKDWFVWCDENGPLCPLPDLLMMPLRPCLRFPPGIREPRARFFSLVGLIGPPEEARLRAEGFLVRDGKTLIAPASGRLHMFANDWRCAYGNNEKSLALLVIEERDPSAADARNGPPAP
jgi:hypothetical protein